MMHRFIKMVPKVPAEHLKSLGPELHKENLFRIIVFIVFISCLEFVGLLFFFISERFHPSSLILMENLRLPALVFVVFQILYLIGAILLHRSFIESVTPFRKFFNIACIFSLLCLSLLFTLVTEDNTAYAVGILSISAAFYMLPWHAVFLYLFSFILYCFLLPYYIQSDTVIMTFRIEMFLINILAWIFSSQMFSFYYQLFLDKKKIVDQKDKLALLSIQDSMTGLFNHRSSFDILESEVRRSKRYSTPLSLLLLDVDHFKSVNDTYGHQVGDQVLKSIAAILTEWSRETDFVGRYGGEEFIVIMPETEKKDSIMIAERLRRNIEQWDFKEPPQITISGGLVVYKGESPEEWVEKSDKLLYRAKQKGRNRIEY